MYNAKSIIRKSCFIMIMTIILLAISVTVADAATKAHLKKTSVTIYSDHTYIQKLYTASGKAISNSKVKWATNNKEVATVSFTGKITAHKVGTARISARYGGKCYQSYVTVKGRLKVNKNSLTLSEEGAVKIDVIYPIKKDNVKFSTNNGNISCYWANGDNNNDNIIDYRDKLKSYRNLKLGISLNTWEGSTIITIKMGKEKVRVKVNVTDKGELTGAAYAIDAACGFAKHPSDLRLHRVYYTSDQKDHYGRIYGKWVCTFYVRNDFGENEVLYVVAQKRDDLTDSYDKIYDTNNGYYIVVSAYDSNLEVDFDEYLEIGNHYCINRYYKLFGNSHNIDYD